MTEYMKANITTNTFTVGGGRFIGSEKGTIAFRSIEQLERIIAESKKAALDKHNLDIDIIIDSIEPLD